MRLSGSISSLSFALCCLLPVGAATYEVAQRHPQSSDDGPGDTERPWKTLSKAASEARAGDVVIVRAGTYRERVIMKRSGTAEAPIRFEAAPAEHVICTGADRITGWTSKSNSLAIYTVPWPHRFITWNVSMTHPDDAYHRVIGRCEQVIVEGYLLRQVLDPAHLSPGAFLVDVTNQSLHAWDLGSRDLNKLQVEAALRQEILRIEGDFVHVRGFHFRHAANMAQHGAVVLAGRHDTLEDCVMEAMNSSGATFRGEDAVVRRCVFRNNGQLGFSASRAHRLQFEECLVENNNTKAFDRGWEAGGNKLALCRDAVLERSRFVRNRGNGIWFDIGNTNCTVRHCLIAENEDAGIFYEISFRLHAHDNVIVGNGFAATRGAWGAQAGISLSSSPYCLVERNLIVGNREGFNFREQPRTTPTIEDGKERAIWNHDQTIRNNIIIFNQDAQVWGWFDVKDNRHWPAERHHGTNEPEHARNLTLETLRLTFADNIYFAGPGQGWFTWGPSWSRHKRYDGLREFQADLGIDTAGQTFDPKFVDVRQLDFRVSAETAEQLKAHFPRGSVPSVSLPP